MVARKYCNSSKKPLASWGRDTTTQSTPAKNYNIYLEDLVLFMYLINYTFISVAMHLTWLITSNADYASKNAIKIDFHLSRCS